MSFQLSLERWQRLGGDNVVVVDNEISIYLSVYIRSYINCRLRVSLSIRHLMHCIFHSCTFARFMQSGTLLVEQSALSVEQSALRREMTEEISAVSHLSVAMTTTEVDKTCTTCGKGMTSSFSLDSEFYFKLAVVLIGVVGTAGNALILYVLVASKQHKKHVLIVNQNALDLFSSFFLVLVYAMKLCNFHLSGVHGYWLCITILSEYFVWVGTNGSIINLAIFTIDRYLKVVHSNWSRKYIRLWVIYCAMSLAWIMSIVHNGVLVLLTTEVRNGQCYAAVVFPSYWHEKGYGIWYVSSFYLIILAIFIFCYGKILTAIRRQTRVMAAHSGPASSIAQTQLNQTQSNAIKTMIFVCAFYAITWLPVNVYYFIMSLFADSVHCVYCICIFAAFLYTSANPFIYAVKFDAVRKFLVAMLSCKKNAISQPIETPLAVLPRGTPQGRF